MPDPGPARRAEGGEPSPLDTAEFSLEEIRERLERGRLHVRREGEHSRLEVGGVQAPAGEVAGPVALPTLFPAEGAVQLLVVGGFAEEADLARPLPFWNEDRRGGALIWQALQRSGHVQGRDHELALGAGGAWEETPPGTLGLAMTYAGFRRAGHPVDLEDAARGWNVHRLQALAQACLGRSKGAFHVVAVGEPAAFMMSGCLFGMQGVPLLSLPEPTPESLDQAGIGQLKASDYWIEWAAELMESLP